MLEPNNNTDTAWWVVVRSNKRPDNYPPAFYSGYDSREDAMSVALDCQSKEKELFAQRLIEQKKPTSYTYSVIPRPSKT